MAVPRSHIVTPEAVVLEFEPAGVASRLLAYLLDLGAQFFVLSTVLNVLGLGALGGDTIQGIVIALMAISVFATIFGYPVVGETFWRGRTLGKAALGLRVVTVEGGPVTFRHAAIRSMFVVVDVFSMFGLVGLLSMMFTKRSQRLGDLVAGTIVLRERTTTPAALLMPVRFAPPPGLEGYAASLATGAMSHEEYGAVRSLLLRASSLPRAVRASLAQDIAEPIAKRLRVTPPSNVAPEVFLVCVAAAYQRRMDGPASRAGGTSFQSVWAAPSPVRPPTQAPTAPLSVESGGYTAPI